MDFQKILLGEKQQSTKEHIWYAATFYLRKKGETRNTYLSYLYKIMRLALTKGKSGSFRRNSEENNTSSTHF